MKRNEPEWWEKRLKQLPPALKGGERGWTRGVRSRIQQQPRFARDRRLFAGAGAAVLLAAVTAAAFAGAGLWPNAAQQGTFKEAPLPPLTAVTPVALKVSVSDEAGFRGSYGQPYTALYPNVTLNVVPTGGAWPFESRQRPDFREWLAQEQPDVLMLSEAQYAQLAASGELLALEDAVRQDGFALDALHPGVVEALRGPGKGRLYGLAASYDHLAVFYNPERFDRAGIRYPRDGMSWQELLQLAARFSGGAGGGASGVGGSGGASDKVSIAGKSGEAVSVVSGNTDAGSIGGSGNANGNASSGNGSGGGEAGAADVNGSGGANGNASGDSRNGAANSSASGVDGNGGARGGAVGVDGSAGRVYGLTLPDGSDFYALLQYAGRSAGLALTNATGTRVTVDTPAWRALWSASSEALAQGAVLASPLDAWQTEAERRRKDPFLRGEAAMTLQKLSYAAVIVSAREAGGLPGFPLAVVTEPTPASDPQRSASFTLGAVYAVNARSAHKREAWELVKLIASGTVPRQPALTGEAVPARLGGWPDAREPGDLRRAALLSLRAMPQPAPVPPRFYAAFAEAAARQQQAVASGAATIDAALKELQRQGQLQLDAARQAEGAP